MMVGALRLPHLENVTRSMARITGTRRISHAGDKEARGEDGRGVGEGEEDQAKVAEGTEEDGIEGTGRRIAAERTMDEEDIRLTSGEGR
eukprot:444222-Rhodomonas_salina.2